ncbi:hypothetical protein sr10063 [Sporisorium reilianum SRZ2]|uniref:CCHC-type domain-containing protein n=1 Tax=Sporisorium reilianum (strain SRZ2) TaxID=999809 RepID=E6ZS78_SPORE|nr:hypothetical protein sr10063 [Sporisorium reilianum SRZ2]
MHARGNTSSRTTRLERGSFHPCSGYTGLRLSLPRFSLHRSDNTLCRLRIIQASRSYQPPVLVIVSATSIAIAMTDPLRGRLLLALAYSDTGDPQPTIPWEALSDAHYPKGMSVGPGVVRLTLPLGTTKRDKDRIRKQILLAFVKDFPAAEPISVRFPDGRYGDHRFVDIENPNINIHPATLASHAIAHWQVLGKNFDPGFYLGSDLPPEYIVLDVCNVPRSHQDVVAHSLQTTIHKTFPEQNEYPVSVIDVWSCEEEFLAGHWTYANRLRALLKVEHTSSTFAADMWPGWIYWTDLMTLFELDFRNRFDYCRFCRHEAQAPEVRHTTAKCTLTVCMACRNTGHIAKFCPQAQSANTTPNQPTEVQRRAATELSSEERAFPGGMPDFQHDGDTEMAGSDMGDPREGQRARDEEEQRRADGRDGELSDSALMPPPSPPARAPQPIESENPTVSGTVRERPPSGLDDHESHRPRRETTAPREDVRRQATPSATRAAAQSPTPAAKPSSAQAAIRPQPFRPAHPQSLPRGDALDSGRLPRLPHLNAFGKPHIAGQGSLDRWRSPSRASAGSPQSSRSAMSQDRA